MEIITDNIDTIEKRIRTLFSKCARNELNEMQADEEYKELHCEYTKILVDADEKIQLANQMYDLVERYLRRLDSELFKFKCELEADHNGITEILEKRSLELEGGSLNNSTLNNTVGNNLPSSQKENRFFGMLTNNNGTNLTNPNREQNRYRPRPEKRRNSSSSSAPPEKRLAINTPSSSNANTSINVNPTTPTVAQTPSTQTTTPFNMQHSSILNVNSPIGTSGTSMTPGRRASNVKATSFDNLNANSPINDLTNNRDISIASPSVVPGDLDSNGIFSNQRRHKK